ncbi:5-methylcytosine-specific restriction endonuclease McrA, partial [Aeromicrobium panaciterrae]|nr:5-methylcytosine-specific restriction endonuclease McrA [Aeromicrobium panaciterrae]
SRPSMESDLDHEIPRPDGPTNGTNLRALCRRHHNIKTHQIAEPTDFTMRDQAA